MIATLMSFALPALFIACGLFAAAVLALTWRTYGRELARLHAQLQLVDEFQAYDVRIATVQAREFMTGPRRRGLRARGAAVPTRRSAGRRAVA